MFERIARLTWHHPRKILVVAGLFAVLAGSVGYNVEHHLKAAGFTDPSSESERAAATLARAIGHAADPGIVVLVRARGGGALDVSRADVRAEVARLSGRLRRARYVGDVISPLENPRAGASLLAPDGRSLVLAAYLTTPDLEDSGGIASESAKALVTSRSLEVGFGGFAPSFDEVNDQTRNDLTTAELIAFPLLTLLLLLVFRGVVAAAVPLLIGVLSILGTFLMLRIMSSLVDTSLFALNIATALSLGLAVDYALLIVSRYREELERLGPGQEAHRRTVLTAGRTSVFSGLTVAVGMAALISMPQRFLYSVGAAGATVGVLSATMAIFVVPSLLAVLGPRINALGIRRGASVSDASGGWMRLARGVMRRPRIVAVTTTLLLLGVAAPILGATFTGPSAQAVPPGKPSFAVNAYVQAHYGRALAEGVTVTVEGAVSDMTLDHVAQQLAAVDHIARVVPFTRASPTLAFATLELDRPALDAAAQQAIRHIRNMPEPPGGEVLVNGNTARFIDEKDSLMSNAPRVVALVALMTVTLLFLLTGSVLLPLKTLLMNALTLSATVGVLVIVCQHGFLDEALDYQGPAALEVTSLVFLFAVTFALATDYAVLVMARIKELRDGGLSNEEAVVSGISRTGRIISAAAVMIAVVFAAFAVSPVFFMKQLAVGMAIGVVIDATVVRALLVPSLMRLLGEANWWAPRPLRRFHDRFGISETEPPSVEQLPSIAPIAP